MNLQRLVVIAGALLATVCPKNYARTPEETFKQVCRVVEDTAAQAQRIATDWHKEGKRMYEDAQDRYLNHNKTDLLSLERIKQSLLRNPEEERRQAFNQGMLLGSATGGSTAGLWAYFAGVKAHSKPLKTFGRVYFVSGIASVGALVAYNMMRDQLPQKKS